MTHRAALETMCPGQGRDYTDLERELCKTFIASGVMSGHAEKKANASQQDAKRKTGVWLSGQPQRNRRDKMHLDMGVFSSSQRQRSHSNIFSTARDRRLEPLEIDRHTGQPGVGQLLANLLTTSVGNGSVMVQSCASPNRAVKPPAGAEADKTKWALVLNNTTGDKVTLRRVRKADAWRDVEAAVCRPDVCYQCLVEVSLFSSCPPSMLSNRMEELHKQRRDGRRFHLRVGMPLGDRGGRGCAQCATIALWTSHRMPCGVRHAMSYCAICPALALPVGLIRNLGEFWEAQRTIVPASHGKVEERELQ